MNRRAAAVLSLAAALTLPACGCGSKQMSTDEAARACVVLETCFPAEWRAGRFGSSLSQCATGTSILPPSPGNLVGVPVITSGLEGPLADIYRCLLGAGGDCAKAGECWSRTGKGGTCAPPSSLAGGECTGDVLAGCTADGFTFSVDCASYGSSCHKDAVFFASVSVCDLGACPARTQCRGSQAEVCQGAGILLGDCARFGLSCVVNLDGGATCDTAASCDGGPSTCEGTVAISCSQGKPLRQDCARNGTARRCEAGACVESGNECVSSRDFAACEGTQVKFCQDGLFKTIDCASLGFASCRSGRCEVTPCTATTCAAEGKNCGSISDGCGGTLNCGSCTAPQVCGANAMPNVCGTSTCTPSTCLGRGFTCGTAPDGCGGTLSCGSCTAPRTCASNVCSCTPRTTCAAGQNCGTASDGCGGTLSCGTCTLPQTCGGGGTANVCGAACVPATCLAQSWNCGTAPDGCGATISCGSCSGNRTCGAGGPNVCAMGTCTPTTCAAQGKNCGVISDGCSATLNCGSCLTTQMCVSNVCQ